MADELGVCEQAARAGGAVLQDWLGRFSVREKGPRDLVTQADIAAQDAVRAVVLGSFPDHAFLSEEDDRDAHSGAEYRWIVDPLDGTTNYVHRVPHYAVSVALEHRGQVIVGAIYDPVSDESYTVRRGGGAYLNGLPIRTSNTSRLSEALVAASFSSKVEADSPEIDQFVAVLLNCQAVRRTGSAALNLCYLASGRFDAFWALSTHIWDVAAGVLLVQEAGGIVTELDGSPFRLELPHPIASANAQLHEQFRALLLGARNSL